MIIFFAVVFLFAQVHMEYSNIHLSNRKKTKGQIISGICTQSVTVLFNVSPDMFSFEIVNIKKSGDIDNVSNNTSLCHHLCHYTREST